ncbi:GAF and ANTAR domain-containing protein [Pseudonocardia hydrocarbonoxydans]|uniref:GAF and ANTAR domain-containing protein n=1 Tax=Pseudonocardia hydrocarbonoxydans TaxID=76726 RepID=UPI0011428429|nr:GAF and ANTAR domain-containing protein [Pseudonocardia hydrocarbonoxydans]
MLTAPPGLDRVRVPRPPTTEPTDPSSALGAIPALAVACVPGASHAGVAVAGTDRHLAPVAAAGAVPLGLDELQRRLGHGPSRTSAHRQVTVHIDDMSADHRWPEFRSGARAAGVGAMLCLPLRLDARRPGALSLYATEAGAFDDRAASVARAVAAQAVLAMAESRREEQLREALGRRDVIGQAKGILIERHRLTADAAFSRLSVASQAANVKLVEVAEHLVCTGELPG